MLFITLFYSDRRRAQLLFCHTRCVRNLIFYHSPLKGESPDSGRESEDQLLQALRADEKRQVGRAERGLVPLR